MSSPGEASPSKKRQRPDQVDDDKIMQRYLVTVEYIGSRYLGFQKQKGQDCKTVQGALEEAFYKFVGKPVESAASSRTDTGVHALRNVCHVDVERVSKRKPGEILPPHEPQVVKRAVNHFLQKDGEDVQVMDVKCVPRDFHARFEAKERTYHYRIIASTETLSIFERNRAWHIHEDLHVPRMMEACGYLMGHHDFSSFRASGCQAKSPIRTLDELHVCEMPSLLCCYPSERQRNQSVNKSSHGIDEEAVCCPAALKVQSTNECGSIPSDPIPILDMETVEQMTVNISRERERVPPHCYVITARARSFLYHQVRLMVGLLKAVGNGEIPASEVPHILDAKTVTKVPPMAPACGLYLADVKYDL